MVRRCDVWQVAGWTMLHFLWLGTLAGLMAGACRLVLRRASANVRYVAALACLALLAALPVGIGAWLVAQPQAMHSPFMTVEPIAIAEAPQPETKEGVDLAVTHLGATSAKDATPIAGDRLESSAPIAERTEFAADRGNHFAIRSRIPALGVDHRHAADIRGSGDGHRRS